MEIRELTKTDLPSLIELYEQLDPGDDNITSQRADEVWADIESDPNIIYIGAVDDGRVLSTCFVAIIPNLTRGGRPMAFIENVVTDSACRRQGLGRMVMKRAIEIAKERGCYKAMLMSGSKRTEAHKFYESLGFASDTKKAFDMRFKD